MKKLAPILLLIVFKISFADQVREFSIEQIEELGHEIYEQDFYSARATDVMLSKISDPFSFGIRGWIYEEKEKEKVVTFIGDNEGTLVGLFEVKLRKKKIKSSKLDSIELTPDQVSLFKARSLAISNIDTFCAQQYNTIILKDVEKDALLVYALAATTDPDAVLVGGHYRFTISKDGKEIIQKDRLFKGCLTLDKTPDDMPKGAKLAALTMSHIVSDTPVETHVFLNLLHGMTFYVATGENKIWKIEDGKIQKIKMR